MPYRRGQGLSADQGTFAGDSVDHERATKGDDAANRLQIRLLETDQLDDALACLAYLRALPEVDPRRVAAVGHSLGGMLTVILAERDSSLRAAVEFAGAANSWRSSPPLRARLLAAVDRIAVPIFFISAANDYSVAATQEMSDEMGRLGKPHRMKVYPAFGPTSDEGHSFIYLAVPAWEANVFGFLSEHMR
jgi:dienelactone hydrolase